MKRLFTLFLGLILAVGLVGCDSDDNGGDEPAATAQVRFVHASPDAGPVDVTVDGETVAEGFAFEAPAANASPYVDVPVDADADIEVQAGGSTVLTVNADQVNLDENQRYTVIVGGAVSQDGPEAILLTDNFQSLNSGQIGLRLVHASLFVDNNIGAVDIYLTPQGAPLTEEGLVAQGFEFGDDTGAQFGTAGTFIAQGLSGEPQVVTVTASGSTQPALQVEINSDSATSLSVGEGDYVTGIAADVPDGQGGITAGALAITESAPSDN